MEQLLTVPEAAARLGVSRRQLDRYHASGRVRYVRFGYKTIRVTPSELDRFIRANERTKRVRQ